jgi:hypothetical protein
MGNNVNLCAMMGLPDALLCPACHGQTPSDFDDYDIDCGNPFPEPGQVSLSSQCRVCGYAWKYEGRLTFKQTSYDDRCDICGKGCVGAVPGWRIQGMKLHCPECVAKLAG